jgi:ketosteroid isomerase-like protein
MHDDEQQIRELVSAWMSATKRGDLDTLLALMADDIVFLVPGQAPMDKAGYAKLQKAQWRRVSPTSRERATSRRSRCGVTGRSCGPKLSIAVKPRAGGRSITRARIHALHPQEGIVASGYSRATPNVLAPAPPSDQ